jgi:hypothetical protein
VARVRTPLVLLLVHLPAQQVRGRGITIAERESERASE